MMRKKERQGERGAGLIEYAILVLFISIIAFAGTQRFYQGVWRMVGTSNTIIKGSIGGVNGIEHPNNG